VMDKRFVFINHNPRNFGRRHDLRIINKHVQQYCWRRRARTSRLCSLQPLSTDRLRNISRIHETLSVGRSAHARTYRSREKRLYFSLCTEIGAGTIDPFNTLTSSECTWLSETLDYCEKYSLSLVLICAMRLLTTLHRSLLKIRRFANPSEHRRQLQDLNNPHLLLCVGR
jgi:hypothetical protein